MENIACIYCEKDQLEVPLIQITYSGQSFYICPQHLPILIHKPAELADRLPGLEMLQPPDTSHH